MPSGGQGRLLGIPDSGAHQTCLMSHPSPLSGEELAAIQARVAAAFEWAMATEGTGEPEVRLDY